MIKRTLIIAGIFVLFVSSAIAEGVLVIHAGTVLVTPGEKPLTEQTIVIRDDRITEIQEGYTIPTDLNSDAQLGSGDSLLNSIMIVRWKK